MVVDQLQRRIKGIGSFYFKSQETGEDIFNSLGGRLVWNSVWHLSHRLLAHRYLTPVEHFQAVDPQYIAYDAVHTYFSIRHGAGHVVSGDWDLDSNRVPLDVNPFEQSDYEYESYGNVEVIYGLKERFVDGKDWEATDLYEHSMRRLEQGHHLWGFGASTAEEFETYCEKIDSLYRTIQRRGYKSQQELPNGRIGDEVSVLIGRDGEYFFNNGIHRLAIARVLGLDSIPVVVTARHQSWAAFRQQVANQRDDSYPDHPDLTVL